MVLRWKEGQPNIVGVSLFSVSCETLPHFWTEFVNLNVIKIT